MKKTMLPSRAWAFALSLALLSSCAWRGKQEAPDDFHTSGSREADQRAEQRIAKDQQLTGQGEGNKEETKAGNKPVDKPASPAAPNTKTANVKRPLFDRLGGDAGIAAIVDDFITRALADPRVNWERKGVESGGFLGVREKSMYWNPTGENVTRLKKHLGQFLTLATGGAPKYEGKEMKEAHAGMKITNAEFDASVGDLKATLDKLGVAVDEQKELLAVVESTRPQVVEER